MNYLKPSPGCVNCYCGALNTPGCLQCNYCRDCLCHCKTCRNCGVKHAWEFCRVCGRCKRNPAAGTPGVYKCTCRTRPKAQRMLPPPLRSFKSQKLRRPIGLEIELSIPGDIDAIRHRSPVAFQWTHDGSITVGGLEMVVSPLVGDALVNGLHYLCNSFEKQKSAVDGTCGYHVHVGADEWGPYELRRLLILYYKFEDVFYDIVQEGRDKAKLNARGESKCYCKRLAWTNKFYSTLAALKQPGEIRRHLITTLYPDWVPGIATGTRNPRIDMRGVRRHKYENCRYYGLNLHTWFERGTVEYRHHEGTLNRDKLIYWALWCGWFTEAASCLSDSQIAGCTTIEQLLLNRWSTSTGYFQFPSDVAAYVLQTREERIKVQKKEVPF